MDIKCLTLGDFETNCYVLRTDASAKECLIVDPGFSPQALIDFLQKESLTPKQVLLTHGHCDHIFGITAVQDAFGPIPVGIGKINAPMLGSSQLNLSMMMGMQLQLPDADELYEPGDVLSFDGMELKVLLTPGHTAGGICFYAANDAVVFSGDTLFNGSIGRHDFPGGNLQALLSSIRNELFTLPDETQTLSGHGPETTIGHEKRTNPFLT